MNLEILKGNDGKGIAVIFCDCRPFAWAFMESCVDCGMFPKELVHKRSITNEILGRCNIDSSTLSKLDLKWVSRKKRGKGNEVQQALRNKSNTTD